MAAVEGCEVAAFCIAEWARKAARKFERKGRLVVIVAMSGCGFEVRYARCSGIKDTRVTSRLIRNVLRGIFILSTRTRYRGPVVIGVPKSCMATEVRWWRSLGSQRDGWK